MLQPIIICLYIICFGISNGFLIKRSNNDDLQSCNIESLNGNSYKYFNVSDFGNMSANESIDVEFYFKLYAVEFCAVLTTKASRSDTLHSHVACLRDSAPSYIWRYPLFESDRSLILKDKMVHLRIIVHDGTMQVITNNEHEPILECNNIEDLPIHFLSFQIPSDGTLIIFYGCEQNQEYYKRFTSDLENN